ncbi:MAG: hypothetical protein IPN17_27955 [Deltaproteobacteria bacterium]|jgi:pyruvate dehydrogenase E2 component (dihydrolipoamide acetyltransferase)|nr:hypothetical protein [Deltaproteobacteria bacterium]MBK7069830.1 hypothetical protein [Deltaproteobacteria bacterium]MBK8695993.1 hypothetical protein [Deltaproteobacteria bacterium]MBP6831327.1 hypothetical protein [Deltaproteobacteria bacterium]
MTALDESTHRPSEQPLWRQGTLSDDEFERAALAITPSWELGLDAAHATLSSPPPVAVTANAFAAPSAAVHSMLASAAVEATPSLPTPAPTTTTPAKAVGVAPVEASMMSGSAKVSDAPPRRPPSMRPPVARRSSDDAFEAPKRSNNKVWAAVGGAMLLAGALFVGFASSSSNTPSTPAPEPAPVAAPEPPAAPVAEPAPPPAVAVAAPEPVAPAAPVAAPEPPPPAPEPPPPAVVAAPEPPPPAPPAPVVMAAAPVAPALVRHRVIREPVRPAPVARAPRVRAPAASEPARPAAAPRAPSGAGFVTESPY